MRVGIGLWSGIGIAWLDLVAGMRFQMGRNGMGHWIWGICLHGLDEGLV
jgi:hypothetical protein